VTKYKQKAHICVIPASQPYSVKSSLQNVVFLATTAISNSFAIFSGHLSIVVVNKPDTFNTRLNA
jgi:hypothetical protein